MFGNLKYLFLYLYEATEKMEEKSADIAEKHRERMEAFRLEHKEMEEKGRERIAQMRQDTKERVSTQVREIVGDLGLATHEELEDLKKLVTDVASKLDKLDKKK